MKSLNLLRWCIILMLLLCGTPGSARGQMEAKLDIPVEPSTLERRSPLGFKSPHLVYGSAASAGPHFNVVKQFEETSFYLKDTDFITTTLGWAVGEPHWDQAMKVYTGTIVKTTDGGATWITQTIPTVETLRGVDFVDANNGWAVGVNGAIVHTTDGGLHWVKQSVATADEFRGVVFADATHGWATSLHPTHYDWLGDPDNWKASLWHTGDGGAVWLTQTLPISASILNRIDFVDAQHGWVVGVKYMGDDEYGDPQHRGVIYHTDNGGVTWVEQPYGPEDLEIAFTGVDFVDTQYGWVVGFPTVSSLSGGTIFHTTDGGATWQRQTPSGSLWDVQFIDRNRGYAVGFDYISAWGPPVWRTLDGGATWEEAAMEHHDNDGLYGIAVMPDRAVALGDHDYVCISTDPWGSYGWPHGENLFTQKYVNVHYKFEDVFFVDDSHGWAVGSRSYLPELTGQVIMVTQDGGLTWQTQYEKAPSLSDLFSYFRLDSVHFADAQNGWAVGVSESRHDAILHTVDGGLHWVEQGQELYASWDLEFFAVQFLDSQEGWALAVDNFPSSNIFLAHTTDGGVHWNWVDTGIAGTIGIGFALVQGGVDFTDAQHGWAVGGLAEVVHTEDGGSQWISQTLPLDWRRVYAVEFMGNQEGWIAGEGLFHTGNGGALWDEQSIGVAGDFQDIQFVDANHGWIAGDRGVILYTANAGSSWALVEQAVTGASLRGLSFTAPQKGWLAGDYGTILAVTPRPNQSPNVPSNPVPADGASDVPTNPMLSWQGGDPDGDPVTYTLALGTGDPPPVVAPSLTVTYYTPGLLDANTTYHWVVTATDGLSASVGATWSFTTSDVIAPPAVPVLLFPPDGAVTATQAITFAWQAGVGGSVDGYNLRLDGILLTTTATSWPTVLSTGVHTWTVRAYNAAGYSGWAADWTVRVGAVQHRIYLPVVVREN